MSCWIASSCSSFSMRAVNAAISFMTFLRCSPRDKFARSCLHCPLVYHNNCYSKPMNPNGILIKGDPHAHFAFPAGRFAGADGDESGGSRLPLAAQGSGDPFHDPVLCRQEGARSL